MRSMCASAQATKHRAIQTVLQHSQGSRMSDSKISRAQRWAATAKGAVEKYKGCVHLKVVEQRRVKGVHACAKSSVHAGGCSACTVRRSRELMWLGTNVSKALLKHAAHNWMRQCNLLQRSQSPCCQFIHTTRWFACYSDSMSCLASFATCILQARYQAIPLYATAYPAFANKHDCKGHQKPISMLAAASTLLPAALRASLHCSALCPVKSINCFTAASSSAPLAATPAASVPGVAPPAAELGAALLWCAGAGADAGVLPAPASVLGPAAAPLVAAGSEPLVVIAFGDSPAVVSAVLSICTGEGQLF